MGKGQGKGQGRRKGSRDKKPRKSRCANKEADTATSRGDLSSENHVSEMQGARGVNRGQTGPRSQVHGQMSLQEMNSERRLAPLFNGGSGRGAAHSGREREGSGAQREGAGGETDGARGAAREREGAGGETEGARGGAALSGREREGRPRERTKRVCKAYKKRPSSESQISIHQQKCATLQ